MKTLLPLLISGFVLCGFFAVCLSAALLPRSEPEPVSDSVVLPEPETIYISEYSIPFSIVYPDYNSSYNYAWSFTDSFRSWSNAANISNASVLGNVLYFSSLNSSLFNHTLFFKCDIVDSSNNFVDSVIYAFRFIKFPVSSSVSSSTRSVLLDPEIEDEPEQQQQPQEEINTDTVTNQQPEPETEDEPEPEPEPER